MRERKVKSTESQFMDRASDIVNAMADSRLYAGMEIDIDPKMRAIRCGTNNGTVMYYPMRGVWQYKQQVFEFAGGNDTAFLEWIEAFYVDDRIVQKHRRDNQTRRQRESHKL